MQVDEGADDRQAQAGAALATRHAVFRALDELGAQLLGRLGTETAKRVDTYATALHHGMTVDALSDLDLAYTPPLGSPWDATQAAAQTWTREHPSDGSDPT